MEKALFSGINEAICDLLRSAKQEVKIAVCWFTNAEIFRALTESIQKGVKVEVLLHNDAINFKKKGSLDFKSLLGNDNVHIRTSNEYKPMHNKYCIIDSETIITGSYNYTYYAKNKNYENVFIYSGNKEIINAYQNNFNEIRDKLEPLTSKNYENLINSDIFSLSPITDYVAYDYFYQGVEENNKEYLREGYNLASEVQELNNILKEKKIETKKRLKYSIYLQTVPNPTLLFEKGIIIPSDTGEVITIRDVITVNAEEITPSKNEINNKIYIDNKNGISDISNELISKSFKDLQNAKPRKLEMQGFYEIDNDGMLSGKTIIEGKTVDLGSKSIAKYLTLE